MKYNVKVFWEKRSAESFADNKYSRVHKWIFDGGAQVTASSSPQVVPVPMSDGKAVDPEDAFVASLSSCHMLFFLSLAAAQKYCIETYEDNAEGVMSKNEHGQMAMTVVTLKPTIIFSGNNIPSYDQVAALHEQAHEKCYIANSVKTEIKMIQG
ncbi:MAG: OsmC family protein [Chitinophagaceae bacterium]